MLNEIREPRFRF